MSYELVTAEESLGQVGSNAGFYKLARFCETQGPQCKALFTEGKCFDPEALREELLGISEAPADVAELISEVARLLEGITEPVWVAQ